MIKVPYMHVGKCQNYTLLYNQFTLIKETQADNKHTKCTPNAN
jgi:hypothetical protein